MEQSALSTAKQALLQKWLRGEAQKPGTGPGHVIPRRTGSGPIPLSFAQQRLWYFYQLEPHSPLYTMPIAVRIRGPLQPDALRKGLDAVAARHQALRTRFDGAVPAQVVHAPSPLPMPIVDLRHLPAETRDVEAMRLVEAEARRPFDLRRDILIRAMLVRVGEEDWVFLALMHHIISDDWSWRVLCGELGKFYDEFVSGRPAGLGEPEIQYADFASWQQQAPAGPAMNELLKYWRRQLADAPAVLELPTARPRPALQSFRGALEWLRVPDATCEKLNALSQRAGATLFSTLLAAFQTLLHRYTGREILLVGSPAAGRTRFHLETAIGLFVNTLTLCADFRGNPSFADLLSQVQRAVLEALAHQELPFEKLVEELRPPRSSSHLPLVQVLFALQDDLSENLRLAGTNITILDLDTGTSKFDLTLSVVKSASGLNCCAEYNTDLFDATTARQFLRHYVTLLESIVANPNQSVADLPMLPRDEVEHLIVEVNRTDMEYPRERCVHEIFELQAEQRPESVAVEFQGQALTYGELNRRANKVAHALRRRGVGPDDVVALCAERSQEMVVMLLGIMKAGGAYLPLDPSYPASRLGFMLRDSKARLLLAGVGGTLLENLRQENVPTLALESETAWAAEPDENLHSGAGPENLVYLIYTSGSTGRPKGVQVPHRAVVNFLHSMQRVPGFGAGDTVLSVTSLSFDIAGLEIFLPLSAGGRVVLADKDTVLDPAQLARLIRTSGATVMQATPSLWRSLVESGWEGNRALKILCGGEALSRQLADQLLVRGAEVWNMYGPTETTIWSTASRLAPGEASVSLGDPIANTRIYVLDGRLQPVPIGVPGEIYIGGDGVARGYLDRPELTGQKFIPDPFGSGSTRLYRTGDLARRRFDGGLEFLGRADHEVKLRGHRIDLGDIESNLRQYSGVSDAVVILRDREEVRAELCGYLVCAGGLRPGAPELRQFLKERLPEYMVPGSFVFLEKFPQTPNGKIDRKALPEPQAASRGNGRVSAPPQTPAEKALAGIWREVLRVEEIGIHDNFFELGGHSLLAMQLLSRVRQAFRIELTLRSILESPTISGLARVLARCESRPVIGSIPRARNVSAIEAKEWLERLDGLSGTEVERLLQKVMPDQERNV